MKCIKVEPQKRPEVIEIENGLESLQTAVDGYIEVLYPWDDLVGIVCNEEGKINGMELNRALTDEDGNIYDILAGPFLVVGLTDDDFGDIPEDLVDKYLKRFESPEEFVRINGRIIAVKTEVL